MTRILLSLLVMIGLATGAVAQDEAVHDEIRAMRDAAIAAFGARDRDAFAALLADDVYFTAMNNEAVHGKSDALAYYDRMLNASDGLIDDVAVTFESDVLSALYAENSVAVATGSSQASFDMRAGLEFEMPLRWTAVLSNQSGAWQIAGMHFSANIFDNPLDTGLRRYLWVIVASAVAMGLLIGLILGRRRSA